MQCAIFIVFERKTSISASVTSGRGEGPPSIVTVAVVVSIRLHHQQCDKFRKMQEENDVDRSRHYIWGASLPFLPLGAPSKGMYYTSLMARGPCPLQSGWCLDLLTWPTLKKSLFIRGIGIKRTPGCVTSGCWSIWLQM